jgi:periplasmic divalent cation tolerance protein
MHDRQNAVDFRCMDTADALVVFVTCPEAAAEPMARALVERRLAACVNLLPKIRSIYRWEGRVEAADEVLMLAKTTVGGYPALETQVRLLHPYKVPEILALRCERGLPDYLGWLAEATR